MNLVQMSLTALAMILVIIGLSTLFIHKLQPMGNKEYTKNSL